MIYRIEVGRKPGFTDPSGKNIKQILLSRGIKRVRKVKVIQVWLLEGELSRDRLERLAIKLFTDPVIEQFRINRSLARQSKNQKIVGVTYNPGVTDPSEDTVKKAVSDLGTEGVKAVKSGKKYVIRGFIANGELEIARRELINPIIQHQVKDWKKEKVSSGYAEYQFKLIIVPLLHANDQQLREISKERQLGLNLTEMKRIQEHFRHKRPDSLG